MNFQSVLIMSSTRESQHNAVVREVPHASAPHADVLWIEETPSIKVETIRNLIVWTTTRPYVAEHKTVVILEANRMTREAQNALLKTLEEPPSRTRMILTTSQELGLLETIRSRCLTIKDPVGKGKEQDIESPTPFPATLAEAFQMAEEIGKDRETALEWCERQCVLYATALRNHPSHTRLTILKQLQIAIRRLKRNIHVKLVLESLFFASLENLDYFPESALKNP